jgi:hypothetical protein
MTPKNKIACGTKLVCAPSDRKHLTVMFLTFASTRLVTCHNRPTIFLMQLIRSLVTSDVLLDIEHFL